MRLRHDELGPHVLEAVVREAEKNGLDAEVVISKRGTPYVQISCLPHDYSVCWFYGSHRKGTRRGLKVFWPFPSFNREQRTRFVQAPRYLCADNQSSGQLDEMACGVIEFVLTNPTGDL